MCPTPDLPRAHLLETEVPPPHVVGVGSSTYSRRSGRTDGGTQIERPLRDLGQDNPKIPSKFYSRKERGRISHLWERPLPDFWVLVFSPVQDRAPSTFLPSSFKTKDSGLGCIVFWHYSDTLNPWSLTYVWLYIVLWYPVETKSWYLGNVVLFICLRNY